MKNDQIQKTNKLNTEYDRVVKILLIGSSGVGKSSISNQFVNNKFHEDTLNTIGVDLKLKILNMKG